VKWKNIPQVFDKWKNIPYLCRRNEPPAAKLWFACILKLPLSIQSAHAL
jgi:hypothetical protein